eukprot:5354835-Lingulodinium_polyedra.AAC.1
MIASKIVDPNVGKKHNVRASFATAFRGVTRPVAWQPLTVWSRSGPPVESLEFVVGISPQTLDVCQVDVWVVS